MLKNNLFFFIYYIEQADKEQANYALRAVASCLLTTNKCSHIYLSLIF